MPNGNTGRDGWIHRKNDTIWKILGAIVLPTTAWLLLTTVSHSGQLAESVSKLDRATEDQENAEEERKVIYRRVERLDERTQNIQKSLDRQDQKLDRILEKVER